MGANGTHDSGALETEEGRLYKTVASISENIKVLEPKDPKRGGKLPEESHTPNRTYVSYMSDGSDVKEIAHYDSEGKKVFSIHTAEHKGLSPHYHIWSNGKQSKEAYPLTPEMYQLLEYVRSYGKK